MQLRKTRKWADPLALAAGIPEAEKRWVLLHSALANDFTGRYSLLALAAREAIVADSFDALAARLTSGGHNLDNAWFGYLGYGLKNTLERLPEDAPFGIAMPDLQMVQYGLILLFDHEAQVIEVWSDSEEVLSQIPDAVGGEEYAPEIAGLSSNMTKREYLAKVEEIQEAIRRGDLYQANLTRKFFGGIKNAKPLAIFRRLCAVSPAPYAAFLKLADITVISSSPERFLAISAQGRVDTRPIKGSAPRFADPLADAASKAALQHSEKDRAENLMIVDLSRNDIARHCLPGSVKTSNLFEVTSYATVHHMASTVQGQKQPEASVLDVVKGCFPPGSMTGAPKIKAMELCTALERVKRGVYAGAIGWFGGDGSVDLSVVIRTLIIQGDRFEFQVGGAIVSDSDPEAEWRETLTKAKALAVTLGIAEGELAGL